MKQFIRKLFPDNNENNATSKKASQVFSFVFTASKWLWITAVIFVCFAVFHYYDYADTLDNAIMLGESILDGKFTQYYSYAAENAIMFFFTVFFLYGTCQPLYCTAQTDLNICIPQKLCFGVNYSSSCR